MNMFVVFVFVLRHFAEQRSRVVAPEENGIRENFF